MNLKREISVKKHLRKKMTQSELQLSLLCIIPVLLVFVFNYLPMGGLVMAFKRFDYSKGIFGSDWVGLQNFKVFVGSNEFFKITWNTISLNALFIVFGLIAAIIVAVLLFEMKSRLATKTFQTVLITPNFLSWVVVAYMAYAILHTEHGSLNKILSSLGLEKVDWYSSPKAWPVILTVASIWKNVGMDSIIYYAALMGVDESLFEAAKLDGANKFKQVIHIMIPSLLPLMTILTILKIGNIFRADFGLFYQVTRDVGVLYETTDVIDTYIFRTMRVLGDMGLSSAVGLLQSVVGFVMVMATNYVAKKIDPERSLF